jgi:pyruvate dehydrogenase E2 component (dihydrolipoamide acetyltransferase)
MQLCFPNPHLQEEYPMATPIQMPKQGQSVESCVISEWLKQKGDPVKRGEILFTFETDKAAFEFESPVSGILLDIFYHAQDDVPVLETVAVIGEKGENVDPFKPRKNADSSAPDAEKVSLEPLSPVKNSSSIIPDNAPGSSVKSQPVSFSASPRAKKRAEERGIDLGAISGTGPHGRIIERDVLAQPALTKTASSRAQAEGLASPAEGSGIRGRVRAADLISPRAQAAAASAKDTFSEISLTKIRKLIGARMVQSLQQSAQLTMTAFADATALLAYRKQIKTRGASLGLPDLTVTDLLAFAAARTLAGFPELNALYKEDKIIRYDHVHLAVAVDTPRGLMVPVVRFADLLPLANLAAAMKDFARQCREGSINPDFLSGGTITMTNLGMFGIDSFTPVLNPPQVAILGINAIAPRPVQTENGAYELRPHIGFSLTIDHQVVDGAPGARFLKTLCDNIAAIDFMLTVW